MFRRSDSDLPAALVRVMGRRPPRGLPKWLVPSGLPALVQPGGVALSEAAVVGVLSILYDRGLRVPSAGDHEGLRHWVTQASGAAFALALLDRWAANGARAEARWCTKPLLIWPDPDNTAEVCRMVNRFRRRKHSGGAGFLLQVLEQLGGRHALASLAMRAKAPFSGVQVDWARGILEASKVDPAELEAVRPLAVDDHEADEDGIVTVSFAPDVQAQIVPGIGPRRAGARWIVGGRKRSRAPNGLAKRQPDEMKAFKSQLREVDRTLLREWREIERKWVDPHGRPWRHWSAYFEHRLLRRLARDLLFEVWRDGRWVSFLCHPGRDHTVALGPQLSVRDEDPVRLWHPADVDPAEREVWRDRWLELRPVPLVNPLDRPVHGAGALRKAYHWNLTSEYGFHPFVVVDLDDEVHIRLPGDYSLVARASGPTYRKRVGDMRFRHEERDVPMNDVPARMVSEMTRHVRKWGPVARS